MTRQAFFYDLLSGRVLQHWPHVFFIHYQCPEGRSIAPLYVKYSIIHPI